MLVNRDGTSFDDETPARLGDQRATTPERNADGDPLSMDRRLAVVIAGTRADWPGGVRTLTSREPTREPNGTLWFGAELDPDGDQVWFRIADETLGRMPEKTPADRGRCLVDALIVWITPDRALQPGINRFEVRVSDAGDTWLERLRC